jgi:hypothetical protein
MPSSGIWRRVDILLTDVSEKGIASIFRVEERKQCEQVLIDRNILEMTRN